MSGVDKVIWKKIIKFLPVVNGRESERDKERVQRYVGKMFVVIKLNWLNALEIFDTFIFVHCAFV